MTCALLPVGGCFYASEIEVKNDSLEWLRSQFVMRASACEPGIASDGLRARLRVGASGFRAGVEDEARFRAVREQAALLVHDPAFRGGDPAAGMDQLALDANRPGCRQDGPHEVNLELQ